ncbi:HD domain-containing protein [Paraburkholderia kirstenboschensis]|uniref:Phosphohydrolase n=1 Tax=Paraburkholderia kirstenboschensis TaxID=1245436 RepID=A0ABZ0E8A9_9BURK|nr:phosphohydrolase [Paraburkholderia kirstenboschensis]WOD13488.1 phosphohydrolase [Paraburkholderia kirstenboschensis]
MSSQRAARPVEVAGVRIPHTPLAIAAADTAQSSLPEVVTAHASRVFVFASLAAQREGCACEPDTLYVAAMFANMGLNAAYAHSALRYEIDGADAAYSFLQHQGALADVLDDVWRAIALHMTPGLPAGISPLARVLSSAVRTDLFADDLDAYTHMERAALLATYPRGAGFKEKIIETIGHGVMHRPLSTFGTLSADVLDRINPDFYRLNFCGLILGSPLKD